MELHIILPGRPAELVARILDGRLEIVPPVPGTPAQPRIQLPAA